MLYRLTKSKFILGIQCEKALYLDVYKPNLAWYSHETLKRFRKGRDFEYNVKALFPNAIDISSILGRRIEKYPELTIESLKTHGEVTLYEAGFVYNQVLILADVVHKNSDGNISVYEIKNSLSVKEVFRQDINLQYYIISHCLDRLSSFSIIYNDGNDNPVYEELTSDAIKAEELIAKQIERFHDVLQGIEPTISTGEHCSTPYDCPYRRYCEGTVSAQLDLGLT